MTVTKQQWVVVIVVLVALSCCSVCIVGVALGNTGYSDSLESKAQDDITLPNETALLSRRLFQLSESAYGTNYTYFLAFGVCGSTVVLSLFVVVMAAIGVAKRL